VSRPMMRIYWPTRLRSVPEHWEEIEKTVCIPVTIFPFECINLWHFTSWRPKPWLWHVVISRKQTVKSIVAFQDLSFGESRPAEAN
jgi:hypothetical protein